MNIEDIDWNNPPKRIIFSVNREGEEMILAEQVPLNRTNKNSKTYDLLHKILREGEQNLEIVTRNKVLKYEKGTDSYALLNLTTKVRTKDLIYYLTKN
ncbi:MAG: hypothetical protein PHQ66_01345 [Candidatus Nanoarchaeia archaeon]|nr:hypothetical protein [Candidatus Nanoarchaeia archaeon]MDD5357979.1 hypothetical protein [Candidatus Nanoarchaeia archaeon]MDD5588898.1 hypothetical protein [Candidatus Nanoarchaeia archaeon]